MQNVLNHLKTLENLLNQKRPRNLLLQVFKSKHFKFRKSIKQKRRGKEKTLLFSMWILRVNLCIQFQYNKRNLKEQKPAKSDVILRLQVS